MFGVGIMEVSKLFTFCIYGKTFFFSPVVRY